MLTSCYPICQKDQLGLIEFVFVHFPILVQELCLLAANVFYKCVS